MWWLVLVCLLVIAVALLLAALCDGIGLYTASNSSRNIATITLLAMRWDSDNRGMDFFLVGTTL